MSNKRSSQFQGRPEEPFDEAPDREFEQRTTATAAQMARRKVIKPARPRGSNRPASGITVNANANPSPFGGGGGGGGFSQQPAAQPANTPTSNIFGGLGSSQQPAQTNDNASASNPFAYGSAQPAAPSNNNFQAPTSFNFAAQSASPAFNASASSSFPPFRQDQQSPAPSNTFSSSFSAFGQQQPQQSAAPSSNDTSAASPFAFGAGNNNPTPFAFGGAPNNATPFNFGQPQTPQPEVSQASGLFGNSLPASSGASSFGIQTTSAPAATSSFGGMFGQSVGQQEQNAQASSPFGGFGQTAPNNPNFSSSGTIAPAATSAAGNFFNGNTFGQQSQSEQSPALFGSLNQATSSAPNFSSSSTTAPAMTTNSGNLFNNSMFGQQSQSEQSPAQFGSVNQATSSASSFNIPTTSAATTMDTSQSLFGHSFGQQSQPQQPPVNFAGYGQAASSGTSSVFASASAPAAPVSIFQNPGTPAPTTASTSLFQNLGAPTATNSPSSLFQNMSTPAANNGSPNIFGNLGSQGHTNQAPESSATQTPQNVAGFSFQSPFQPTTSSASEAMMMSPDRPVAAREDQSQSQPQHQPEPEPEPIAAHAGTPFVSITAPEPVREPESAPEPTPAPARTTTRHTPAPQSLLTAQSSGANIPKALVPSEWMQVSTPSASQKDRVAELDRKLVNLTAALATLNQKFKTKIINASPLADWAAYSRWHFTQSKDITKKMTEVKMERAALNGVTGNESVSSKRKVDEEANGAELNVSPSKRARGGQTTTQAPVGAKSSAKQPLNLFGGFNGTRSGASPSTTSTASNGAQGPLTSTLRLFKEGDKANNNAASTTVHNDSTPSLFPVSRDASSPAPSLFSPTKPADSHTQNTPASDSKSSKVASSTPNPFAKLSTFKGQTQGTQSTSNKSSNATPGTPDLFSASKAAGGQSKQTPVIPPPASDPPNTTNIFAPKQPESESKGTNNTASDSSPFGGRSILSSSAPFKGSPSSSFGSPFKFPSPAPSNSEGQSVLNTPSGASSPAANIFGHLSPQDESEEDDQDEEPEEDARSEEQQVEEEASDAGKLTSSSSKRSRAASETESDTEVDEEEPSRKKQATSTASSARPLKDRISFGPPAETTEPQNAQSLQAREGSATPKQASGAQTPTAKNFFDFAAAGKAQAQAKAAPQTAPPKSQSSAGNQTYTFGTPIKFGPSTAKKDTAGNSLFPFGSSSSTTAKEKEDTTSNSSFIFDPTKKSTRASSLKIAPATQNVSSVSTSQSGDASFHFKPSEKKSAGSSSFTLLPTSEKKNETDNDPFGFLKTTPATEQKAKLTGLFSGPIKSFQFTTPSTENKENTGAPSFNVQAATPTPTSTETGSAIFSSLNAQSLSAPNAGTSGPGSVNSSVFSSRAATPLSDTGDSAAENEGDDGNRASQLDLSGLTEDERQEYEVLFHTGTAAAKSKPPEFQKVGRGSLWILRNKSTGKALVRLRNEGGRVLVNYNIMPVLAARQTKQTVTVSWPQNGKIEPLFIQVPRVDVATELTEVYNRNLPA